MRREVAYGDGGSHIQPLRLGKKRNIKDLGFPTIERNLSVPLSASACGEMDGKERTCSVTDVSRQR